MADEHYHQWISGNGLISLQDVCLRCGVLVANNRRDAPEGVVTPRMAHDRFHDALDELVRDANTRFEALREAVERDD